MNESKPFVWLAFLMEPMAVRDPRVFLPVRMKGWKGGGLLGDKGQQSSAFFSTTRNGVSSPLPESLPTFRALSLVHQDRFDN